MNFGVSPLWAYADYFWPAVMVVAAFAGGLCSLWTIKRLKVRL